MIRVLLNGWRMYRDDPRPRVRKRVAWESLPLKSMYAGAVWAMRKWYQNDARLREKADRLLQDICDSFGWKTRIAARPLGWFAWFMMKREEVRLAAGWNYEPRSFLEKHEAAKILEMRRSAELKPEKRTLPAVSGSPAATFGK